MIDAQKERANKYFRFPTDNIIWLGACLKQDKLYKLKTELQTQQCDAQICQKINSQDLTAAGLDLVTQKYKEGVDMWSRWVVLRICMDLYGLYRFLWICMDLYGFVWNCMNLYRFEWICMELYGFVWICKEVKRWLVGWGPWGGMTASSYRCHTAAPSHMLQKKLHYAMLVKKRECSRQLASDRHFSHLITISAQLINWWCC